MLKKRVKPLLITTVVLFTISIFVGCVQETSGNNSVQNTGSGTENTGGNTGSGGTGSSSGGTSNTPSSGTGGNDSGQNSGSGTGNSGGNTGSGGTGSSSGGTSNTPSSGTGGNDSGQNSGSGTGNSGGNTGSGGTGSSSGGTSSNTPPSENGDDISNLSPIDKNGKINKAFWGTWIRMDNGDKLKITDTAIGSMNTYGFSQSYRYNIKDFKFESENVLVLNDGGINPRLFRESGYAKKFSAKVVGLSDSDSARAASIDIKQKVDKALKQKTVKRQNTINESDKEEEISDENGIVRFQDAVAGEVQKLVIETLTGNVTIDLEPHYDGEDMGIIPVLEDQTCSFKVTYSTSSDSYSYNQIGADYLYSGNTYKVNLDIHNIGNEKIKDGYYSITCDDPNLVILEGKTASPLNTVLPNSTQQVSLKVKYNTIYDEYIDVPLKIQIYDYNTKREWNDTVTLRFYKRPVYISVNAYNTTNSSAQLHGFVVAPDGRSQYFSVGSNDYKQITVPWSKGDSKYLLVVNGATADNEMYYSFKVSDSQINSMSSVDNNLCDWNAFFNRTDSSAALEQIELKYTFETPGNNTEKEAYNVGNGFKLVKSYIQEEDIDYYILNINENTTTISVSAKQLTDINVDVKENGNELSFIADKGYDTYYFELNGKKVQLSDKYTYSLNKADLPVGIYEMYVRAYKSKLIEAEDPINNTTINDFRSNTVVFSVER